MNLKSRSISWQRRTITPMAKAIFCTGCRSEITTTRLPLETALSESSTCDRFRLSIELQFALHHLDHAPADVDAVVGAHRKMQHAGAPRSDTLTDFISE